jgi:ethanolamine ammonia-lyase small subunit
MSATSKMETPNARRAMLANASTAASDPWSALRRFTAARIALGRTGGSQRTSSVLDFRLAQAQARDAVYAPFDALRLLSELTGALAPAGLSDALPPPFGCVLPTAVSDRATYLAQPDFGRRLADGAKHDLLAQTSAWGHRDLAVIVSDGLSAQAAHRHALATVVPLLALLAAEHWTFYPVFFVPFGRVKIQDEIGELLGARHALMLLGERPGLDSPDSLGAYFTHAPTAACRDANRNCVSNIRPEGLPPAAAAKKLARLLTLSARRGVSGVALKDTETSGQLGNL